MYEQRISVRQLVEFVYRSGDLDLRFQGKSKMTDGIKTHQKIQKSQGADYTPEVTLKYDHRILDEEGQEILLRISGRADGILETETGFTIDEIKGVSKALEDIDENSYPVYWAQAKVYAFIFALDEGLDQIEVQLTYAHFESGEIKRLKKNFHFNELKVFLEETVAHYEKWVLMRRKWTQERNKHISTLDFPFVQYRKGQREMAVTVYQAIKKNQIAYIEAPTGIGKTISSLFPAIKSMGEGLTDKIFYLSAKTITKTVAEEAINLLYDQGLALKQITLTAKDRICFLDKATCYPEKCPYAKGHFDRANDALWETVSEQMHYTKDVVEAMAHKYQICPYEFSLDLALYSDVIVCDYNYAFDPRVYLRRFFDVPMESYSFLVDESHNLIDRARTMFSAEISKSKVMAAKKNVGPHDRVLKKTLEGINRVFLDARKKCDDLGIYVDNEEIQEVYTQIRRRATDLEKWLTQNHEFPDYEVVLDLYFDLLSYLRISDLYGEGYLFYMVNGDGPDTRIKLFCVDPSKQLARFIHNSESTVFFSATLTPFPYYRQLITGQAEVTGLRLPSPFDPSHRLVLAAKDVSVKYKDREASEETISQYIHKMAGSKLGNYMVFFPSYQYMSQVYTVFNTHFQDLYDIIIQDKQMSEDERFEFLKTYEDKANQRRLSKGEKSLIGFAVLGGIFSEGIDLKGDLLVGTLIVGVGLPMISFENNLIKAYFGNEGYDFAYRYPGINKVMQGAGRVIRGEDDKGVIILVDMRYHENRYKAILSDHLQQETTDIHTVEQVLKSFWREEP